MESDIKRHGPSEQLPVDNKPGRRAGSDKEGLGEEPGRTPDSAESGVLEKERSKPAPDPKRTPGRAEG